MKTMAFNAMALSEPASGVGVTIRGLVGALSADGTPHVQVYAPRPAASRLPAGTGVQIRPCGWPWPSRALRILWEQLILPVRLRADGAGLLHAPAYVAPLAAPCPVVLTVHDLHVFTHPRCCQVSNRLHYRLMMPPSIRRAAAIIVFSEYVRLVLVSRFPSVAAKTVVIPPGIDPSMRPADPADCEAVRQRYGLPQQFLFFVGDLAPRKNLFRLLDAFSLLAPEKPDLHLVLAGRALRGHRCLTQAASTPGLTGRVILPGYVPLADLPAFYSLAAALVYPSLDEGFGLPVLEAMACGCPVVTTSSGGPREICGDCAVYCQPENVRSIADAIRSLWADPASCRQRVAAGLLRAAPFTWARAADATRTLYRSLLE